MGSDEIGKAVKDARIAAGFSVVCVILIGLLFMVDGRRNKWIAERMDEIRAIVRDFQVMAVSAYAGATAETPDVGGAAADVRGAGGDGAAGVVADGAAGAGVDQAGGAAAAAVNGSGGRRAGMAGGPRGNG